MCRCKMGNPKRSSRFICCKCLKENFVGSGIQRANQREKNHIKDLTCFSPECRGTITKNLEVRYCDSFNEMMEKAEELHREYYNQSVESDCKEKQSKRNHIEAAKNRIKIINQRVLIL